jgi:hypothetical protein
MNRKGEIMNSLKNCAPAALALFSAAIVLNAPATAQTSPPAAATTSAPAAAHARTPRAARAQDPHRVWMTNQRWRYASEARAEADYQAQLAHGSRWPAWHQVNVVTLPAGLRFQMALAPARRPIIPAPSAPSTGSPASASRGASWR